ncbi:MULTISPECIES: hypothetical protein [Cyanophyceae]|uniref:Large polyvalent protein-associated domain-containing protein n=1 Tax=Stenomitos frigidus AS-A4 TaxID=2933935 RepID=A0ABV0KRV8_9CYAN|nr:hypothetical protein [Phormidium sp. FACHB-592]
MVKAQSLDNYYPDAYGEDAATIASVVALGSHAELFDRDTSDEEIVESYFLKVPNSTLIVNRVDTHDQYGLSKSFTVLNGEEPLLQLDSGHVVFNHLSLSQAAALQTEQRAVANPLLVSEPFFQADVAQAMTRGGEAQARVILSQGDAITPAIVAELNDLLAAEEAIRGEDQSSSGLTGHVSYSRFTEYELNQNLSIDTIARQLSAQFPVVEVKLTQEPLMQSVSDYLEATTPEALGSTVYSTYYRWADRNYERDKPEADLVVNGYRVDNLGDRLGGTEAMQFQVVDVAAERVVMDFTFQSGDWVERPQTEPGELPRNEYTGDTVVISALDARLKTQLVEAFEIPVKKAGLVASTYLNEAGVDELSRPNGLVFQREYHDDGSLWRDLVFSRDAVSSEGNAYAIAQAFPDGDGMGIGMPASVELVIQKEFAQLVEQYEQAQQKQPVVARGAEQVQPSQQSQKSVTQSVYDRPKPELERMETLAITLLKSGKTLVSPATFTENGRPLLPPMQLSLSDQVSQGQPLIQRVYEETEYSPGQQSLHLSTVLHDGVLQAMQDDTLKTADGQRVSLPSFDQERPQAVVQKPPVVGYESNANLHLEQESNVMVAAETSVKTQTEIDLRDLMSQKTLGIMETSKVPQKRVEVEGKPQLVDRTPVEGFTMVARAAYGAQNFCQEHNLPHTPATEVIAAAADRLSLDGSAVTGVLNSIDKAKCRPSMEVATQSQSGVWARIEAKYPEYAGKVPKALKTERAAAQAAVAPAQAAVVAATTRQVKAPVLKQSVLEQQQPSQFEMAIVVAAYRLQEAEVDRWGHDNEKSTLIFNRSKEGNISVINKADNVVIATRNAVTSEVIPGVLPPGQDYSQAFKAVVEKQTEKYAAKTAAATPKAKVVAGDGR